MTLSEINMKLAQTCSNCQDCNVNNSCKMFDVVSIMLLSVYKMQLRDAVLTFIHINLFVQHRHGRNITVCVYRKPNYCVYKGHNRCMPMCVCVCMCVTWQYFPTNQMSTDCAAISI